MAQLRRFRPFKTEIGRRYSSHSRTNATDWSQRCASSALWLPSSKKDQTMHSYLNDGLLGWGWILWFGFIFLIFSGFGNWGYTYRIHRKYDLQPRKEARDILNERYARGEITREQFGQLKTDISSE